MCDFLVNINDPLIACFIGHKKIKDEKLVYERVLKIVEELVADDVKYFIFGSKSSFNTLCYKVVSELRDKKYPFIKRVFANCDHHVYPEVYQRLIDSMYEYSYFSQKVKNAGGNKYIFRNQDMIDKSDVVIFYYDESYKKDMMTTKNRRLSFVQKSGTGVAFEYAKKNNKKIINIFNLIC